MRGPKTRPNHQSNAATRANTQQAAAQQAAAARRARGAGGVDVAAKIKELADLKAAGALTDEEFAAAKAKLLG